MQLARKQWCRNRTRHFYIPQMLPLKEETHRKHILQFMCRHKGMLYTSSEHFVTTCPICLKLGIKDRETPFALKVEDER